MVKNVYVRPEDNLERYIYRVIKQVHPDIGINRTAMSTLNTLILDLYRKISKEASEVSHNHKQQTLTSLDVQTAMKLHIPGELQKHAITQSTQACTNYEKSMS